MKKLLIAALCLGVTGLWSCVEDDVYVGPPTVSAPTIAPTAPTAGVDVVVTSTATSTVPLEYVKLFYIKAPSASYTSVEMTAGSANAYSATIPASVNTDGAVITYYVEAKNSAGVIKSAERSYTVGAAPVDYTKLVINEINGIDKYIEFYNAGTVAIDMTGMKLERNNGLLATPAGSEIIFTSGTIQPGKYAISICDAAGALIPSPVPPAAPECVKLNYLASGLSAQAILTIRLYDPAGTEIDSFYTTNTVKNGSYVRIPNGNTIKTGNTGWVANGNNTEGQATPGTANTAGSNATIPGLAVPAPAHP